MAGGKFVDVRQHPWSTEGYPFLPIGQRKGQGTAFSKPVCHHHSGRYQHGGTTEVEESL